MLPRCGASKYVIIPGDYGGLEEAQTLLVHCSLPRIQHPERHMVNTRLDDGVMFTVSWPVRELS